MLKIWNTFSQGLVEVNRIDVFKSNTLRNGGRDGYVDRDCLKMYVGRSDIHRLKLHMSVVLIALFLYCKFKNTLNLHYTNFFFVLM